MASSSFFCLIWAMISLMIPVQLIMFTSEPSSCFAAAASTESTLLTKERSFGKMYAFGDSFTDTGNTESSSGPSNFMHVSSPPYGQTFFHHPTNRYSDGRLVIDFVSEALSLPFLPPYRNPKANKSYGVNFAVAGSTAIIHSFFVKNNMTLNITPQSLETQLIWFREFLESQFGCKDYSTTPRECGSAFKDALIWVGEIGANDYAYSIGSSVSTDTIQHLAINTHTHFLQEVLIKGAKYVVVEGLPPSGCLTLSMALAGEDDRDDMGCVGSENKLSYNHNTKLRARLYQLRKQFPKTVIIYADYWNAYATILRSASKYGFKELFRACCGSGDDGSSYSFDPFNTCGSPSSKTCTNISQYINWDGVHLTEAMNKAVSNAFINGTFCQPTFDYLLGRKSRSEAGRQSMEGPFH